MVLKIDFHVHTRASKDGVSSIEEIIAVARRKGLDGIAITDHDLSMSKSDAERASLDGGLIVIPGVEVTTRCGHVILLYPEEEVLKDPTLDEVVDVARSWGSPIIIPHPMDPLSHGVGGSAVRSIKHHRPILEVVNASTFSIYNRRAKRLAKELCLHEVAGSDAHVASALGSAYTLVDVKDPTIEGILKALRDGKVQACGGHMPITSLVELTVRRISKIV